MNWINYHHLFYFWTVARKGSVTAACRELKLAQPTVSTQLKALEASFGEELFSRSGRTLKLTEAGRVVYRYAEEIFTLGRELGEVMRGNPSERPPELRIGIADVVPKLIAYRLIRPALSLNRPSKVVCLEDKTERLLADLAVQDVDLVISDAPIPSPIKVKAYNHYLGESAVSVLGVEKLARTYRRSFPESLAGAPLLLPFAPAALRQEIDRWLEEREIRPVVVGEFQDSALMRMFGEAGAGLFVVPTVIEAQVCRESRVKVVGRLKEIKEQFYLISVERRVKHPAVVRICEEAKRVLLDEG